MYLSGECDIMYTTNNELGFDYLRDNMVVKAADRVQRKLNFVIIDEVDSVLIDEAVSKKYPEIWELFEDI